MRKGIHPLLHSVRFVMKNGASFRCNIVSKKADPIFLQADVTTHPTWTKEKSGLTLEDERIANVISRFSGFIDGLDDVTGKSEDGKPNEASKS